MAREKRRKGDTIMVYEDPFTREKEEGEAKITKILDTRFDGPFRETYCMVLFHGEEEDFHRLIVEHIPSTATKGPARPTA